MSKRYSMQKIDGTAPQAVPLEDSNTRLGATDIHELGARGIAVAEAIASAEDFNHHCAEMSMRNLVGLVNRVGLDEYACLPDEDREGLLVVTQDTFSFLHGEAAVDNMREVIELRHPATAAEAELYLCQTAFI